MKLQIGNHLGEPVSRGIARSTCSRNYTEHLICELKTAFAISLGEAYPGKQCLGCQCP